MKRLILLALILALVPACLAGCNGNGGGGGNNVEGELEDLMASIYEHLDPPIPFFPLDMPFTEEGDEFGKPVTYFIGAEGIPFTEGLASEAAIGAIPHSIVLLRMEANANVGDAMQTIRENVDPWKWICVGVDPADVIVDSIGDLVIVIISERSADFHEAFLALGA
jgi:hypothetical protein